MSLNDFLAELKEQAIYMEADDDKKKKKEDKKEDTPPPAGDGGDPLQSDTDDNADDAPEDLGAGDPDADGDGTDDEPDDLSGGDDPADDEPGDDDEEAPEEPDMDADDEDDPLDDDEGGDDEPDDLGADDSPEEPDMDSEDDLDAGDDTDEPDDLGDGGDTDEPDDLGGDDTPDAGDGGDGGDMGSGDGGSGNPDDIKGLENEIFADLSDEQKAIRTKELKDRFVELYNLTLAFKEKVDYVKKTSDNIQVITRVSKTLDKLSDMIAHYIHKTFNTKSYIENKSDFYYCLWVLDRINELMGTLTPKEPIKK